MYARIIDVEDVLGWHAKCTVAPYELFCAYRPQSVGVSSGQTQRGYVWMCQHGWGKEHALIVRMRGKQEGVLAKGFISSL